MMGTRVSYLDEQQPLEGYLAALDSARDLLGVLVVPSWLNVNESICRRADRLADMGYAAFVVDLFGAGVQPRPPLLPMEVVGPFLKDRAQFRKRLFAGLDAFRRRPECNSDRMTAIGYCVGGCGVLELARAGAPLRGVVSLHGILTAPIPAQRNAVLSKILVLHGDADPLTSFDQVEAFRIEMRDAEANWELGIYGGARHSFTGEGVLDATSPEAGEPSEFGESGLDALKARLTNLFDRFNARLTVIVIEIRLQGDIACDYGWHDLTLTPRDGGQPVQRKDRYVDICRKNKEGKWKLWMYMDNQDVVDPFQAEKTNSTKVQAYGSF